MTVMFSTSVVNSKDLRASGSEFMARAETRAGSAEINLADAGDFKPGQQVAVYGCNLHYYGTVYNSAAPYFAKNQSPLAGELEFRGLDAGKTWRTYLIHFWKTEPVTFSWMAVEPEYQTIIKREPVLQREWEWLGKNLPVTDDWFSLTDGVEARFAKKDWLPGESVSFHARNRLLASIKEIRGKTLVLTEKAEADCHDAVVRHHDQAALQNAVNRAVAEKKTLLIPAGRYHLDSGLWIRNASLRIEGENRESAVLDVSDDHTAALWIAGGRDVTVRNLGMAGHTGFLEMPSHREFKTATGFAFWPTANQQMEIKGCAAANIVGTERLLFEDVNVTRMASEAFYLHGGDRYGLPPYIQAPHEGMPELQNKWTKSCVFHRCRVWDCGFNAFNNNDHGENTQILHCHVERTANLCENASRFSRIIGNYVLDGCSMSVHGGRISAPDRVGPTQAIIADNVFEGGAFLGGVSVGNCATQVIISNNVFTGFGKECGIFILGGRRVIVTGNHIDMTKSQDYPDNERCGINLEASDVIVANNQIYVRGEMSGKVTGINIADDAVSVSVHDNIIENCGAGVRAGRRVYKNGAFEYARTEAEVRERTGPRLFIEKGLPLRCDDFSPYKNWRIRWGSGKESVIESYDPAACAVTLKEAVEIRPGERFEIYPARRNWQIHNNIINGCKDSMSLSGSPDDGVNIKDNIIS